MKDEQKQGDSATNAKKVITEQERRDGKIKGILQIIVLLGFTLLIIGIIFISIDGSKIMSIESETKQRYLTKMEASCEGYAFSECQVVKVSGQTIELEPLVVKLMVADDLNSSTYESVTFTNLEELPKESLDNRYIKLLIKEGYVSSIEVIGDKSKILEEQEKAVDAYIKDNNLLKRLKSSYSN